MESEYLFSVFSVLLTIDVDVQAFSRLLGCMFFGQPGLRLVEAGRFLVMYAGTNKVITPQLWSASVAPGDQLSMSMILERLNLRTCPRCKIIISSHLESTGNGMTW